LIRLLKYDHSPKYSVDASCHPVGSNSIGEILNPDLLFPHSLLSG
jgi:hypothetical protein